MPTITNRTCDGSACISVRIPPIDSPQVVNMLSEDAAFQAALKHVRCQEVGDLFEEIACSRMALRAYAKFTQALHPAPHGRTRNTYLASNARAADDDCGVFGEQRNQRRDAP